MKKTSYTMGVGLLILLLFMTNYSCSSGRYLRTESAKAVEMTGVYTLILYGGNYPNDIKTLAILTSEGGPSFEMFAPAFDYKIIKDVPAQEAFKRAEEFVSYHHDFWKTQLRKIIDDSGNTIGYEVRPLFHAINAGGSNLLDVYYKKTDGRVVVYIRLGPQLEYMPFEDGGQIMIIK